jgi:hypothetical protein
MIFPKDRAGSSKLTQFSTNIVSLHTCQKGKQGHTGVDRDVESGRDDTSLVQSTVELNDDLSTSVVIDDLEFTNVTYKVSRWSRD